MKINGLTNFLLILIISTCSFASANLLSNGSFEDTDVADHSWAWFDSSLVNSWDGSNIEIWDTFANVTAYEGSQHAELNAHGGGQGVYSISQTFDTQMGGLYEVSFAYSARMSANEAFWVNLNANDNTDLFARLMDDHVVGEWIVFNTSFEAIDLNTTLTFTTANSNYGSVGNFLDNIEINQIFPLQLVNNASEPAGMLLFAIVFLAFMRNRLLKSIAKPLA